MVLLAVLLFLLQVAPPPEEPLEQARRALEMGHPREALDLLRDYYAQSKPPSAFYILRGAAYQRLGDLEKAQRDFRRAVEMDPRDGRAHYLLAVVHQAQGKLLAARESLERAAALRPEEPPIAAALGTVLHQLGFYGQAVEAFLKARASGGGSLRLDTLDRLDRALALAYMRDGKFDRAIEIFQGLPGTGEDRAAVLAYLGYCHLNIGQFEKAKGELQQAVLLDPSHGFARFQLGAALAKLGEREEAIRNLTRALEDPAVGAEAHLELGLILGSTEQVDSAIEHCLKSIELRPHLA
ncbi:MAG: tetratricopeptide repeat protein, partial [Acidobacteriota bacterium]